MSQIPPEWLEKIKAKIYEKENDYDELNEHIYGDLLTGIKQKVSDFGRLLSDNEYESMLMYIDQQMKKCRYSQDYYIGTKTAQNIVAPITQASLKSFYTIGLGGKEISAIQYIKYLLELSDERSKIRTQVYIKHIHDLSNLSEIINISKRFIPIKLTNIVKKYDFKESTDLNNPLYYTITIEFNDVKTEHLITFTQIIDECFYRNEDISFPDINKMVINDSINLRDIEEEFNNDIKDLSQEIGEKGELIETMNIYGKQIDNFLGLIYIVRKDVLSKNKKYKVNHEFKSKIDILIIDHPIFKDIVIFKQSDKTDLLLTDISKNLFNVTEMNFPFHQEKYSLTHALKYIKIIKEDLKEIKPSYSYVLLSPHKNSTFLYITYAIDYEKNNRIKNYFKIKFDIQEKLNTIIKGYINCLSSEVAIDKESRPYIILHGLKFNELAKITFLEKETMESNNILDNYKTFGIEYGIQAMKSELRAYLCSGTVGVQMNDQIDILTHALSWYGHFIPMNAKGITLNNTGFINQFTFSDFGQHIKRTYKGIIEPLQDVTSHVMFGRSSLSK